MPIVRMKTTSAGPDGSRYARKEYPVSAEEGADLVAGGFAEWVEPPRVVEVETAEASRDVEVAAIRVQRPKPNRRGR